MNKNVLSYLIKKGLTSAQAAEKLGVSRKLVTRWAKRYELSFPFRKGTPSILEKSTVKILLKRGYSNKEIAKIYNLKADGISFFRSRNNLYCNKEIPYYKKKFIINDYDKSLIIGSILGDGSIDNNGRFSVTHSMKQSEYCKWKSEKLNGNYRIDKPRFDKRTSKTYYSCSFTKKPCEFTKWLRKELYIPKKRITKESLKYYNDLSLAIHFMDDGSKANSSYRIATDCFDNESLNIFNQHCKSTFGIHFVIDNNGRLYLPIKFKTIFKNIIKPYIHPELEYKL